MTEPILPSDNPDLDREVAELSDAVLEGRMVNLDAASPAAEYMPLIRELREITSQQAPSELRARLTQRLSDEWDAVQRSQGTSRGNVVSANFSRRRLALIAAALIAFVGGAAVLIAALGEGTAAVQGTVIADQGVVPTVALFAVAIVLIALAVYWSRDKDRS